MIDYRIGVKNHECSVSCNFTLHWVHIFQQITLQSFLKRKLNTNHNCSLQHNTLHDSSSDETEKSRRKAATITPLIVANTRSNYLIYRTERRQQLNKRPALLRFILCLRFNRVATRSHRLQAMHLL